MPQRGRQRSRRAPQRFGYAYGIHRDSRGLPRLLLDESDVRMRQWITLSGNSLIDIRRLQDRFGRERGFTWHHTDTVDPLTGRGEVVLIPTHVHSRLQHFGGSNLIRNIRRSNISADNRVRWAQRVARAMREGPRPPEMIDETNLRRSPRNHGTVYIPRVDRMERYRLNPYPHWRSRLRRTMDDGGFIITNCDV